MAAGEESDIVIGNFKISGIRTYSVIMVIILAYVYLCIRSGDPDSLAEFALMAAGFAFGAKATLSK